MQWCFVQLSCLDQRRSCFFRIAHLFTIYLVLMRILRISHQLILIHRPGRYLKRRIQKVRPEIAWRNNGNLDSEGLHLRCERFGKTVHRELCCAVNTEAWKRADEASDGSNVKNMTRFLLAKVRQCFSNDVQ